MARTQREKPVGCRGCGYGYDQNNRAVVVRTTTNPSGYCDDCIDRGIPTSRSAFHALNQKAAARRHASRSSQSQSSQ